MHQIKIVDANLLQWVLEEVLKKHRSHREAANALGINQSTFTRLLNGKICKRIRFDTYESIKNALGSIKVFDLEGSFEASVLTFEGTQVQNRYEAWLDREYSRLAKKTQAIFPALYADRDAKAEITRFLNRVSKTRELPGRTEKRLWLALYRSVETFAAAEDTWGVERSWTELRDAEVLNRYLRAALECERAMLDRERDTDRFNMCTAPEEHFAELAGQ